MKKVFLILTAILVSLSLLACGGQKKEEVKNEAQTETQVQPDTSVMADSTAMPPAGE